MAIIKQIQHKDKAKQGYAEPYSAIFYDGSYNTVNQIIALTGMENLGFGESDRKEWFKNGKWFTDSFIEKIDRGDSVIEIPKPPFAIPNEENETDEENGVEVVFSMTDSKDYSILSYRLIPGTWVYFEVDWKDRVIPHIISEDELKKTFNIIK